MPTYLYRCLRCNAEVEETRPIADRDEPPQVESSDCEHVWKRPMSPTLTVRGRDWGKKGRW